MKGFRGVFIIMLLVGATRLHSAGEVWAWGYNFYGQVGDGTTANHWEPVQTHNLTDVIAIAGGDLHSLALKSDSTVWAWGCNWSGQLGDSTTINRWEPVQTHNLTDVIVIAGGWSHSLALKSDSTVWAWGDNRFGQLGDSTDTNRLEPVQTHNLTDVIAITGGEFHSLALKSDSTVWAWGDNDYGQLGDNTITDRWKPIQTHILTNVIAIDGGGGNHSLAIKSDSTVWAWGGNAYGQVGDSTMFNFRKEPVQTHILTNVIAIAGGYSHSLALKSDSTVWAWGRNGFGQLGDSTDTNRLEPVQTHNLTDVIAIAAGDYHSLAIKSDGTVWAWGHNNRGQLGDSTNTKRWEPVQTHILTNVDLIAGGWSHSLAVTDAPTGIEEEQINNGRQKTELFQNHPNPFIQSTVISYQVPDVETCSSVSLRIYDLSGRLVKTLVNENQKAGCYTVGWDGKDNSGKKVATGIYFYRMEAHTGLATGNFKATRKLTILR